MNNAALINKVRNLKMSALKEKNEIAKNIYSVLISESCKNEKEPKDETVLSHIRKIINNNDETLKLQHNEVLVKENEYLNGLLPATLSEQEIFNHIETQQFVSIAECMKWFKENFSGCYNGKNVNSSYNKWSEAFRKNI